MDFTSTVLIILVVVLLIVTLFVLFLQLRKSQNSTSDVTIALQNVMQIIQQEQTQMAIIAQKVSALETVAQTVNSVQIELRGLNEKVAKVEQNQTLANQSIGGLNNDLTQTGMIITTKVQDVHQQSVNSLYQVSKSLASELAKIQKDVTELYTIARVRQEVEQKIASAVSRLESIIAGTQSKGSAGENIVELAFAKLPPEWQVRNFNVNGKPVEFALRLPNGLILPIDSKWAATNLIEQFASASDPAEQQKLKIEIQRIVIQKAKEVKKYIDPSVTMAFGVAVVPDAAYDLCAGIYPEIFKLGIVLVSYSMFLPYLLLVFQTVLSSEKSIDIQRLGSHLKAVQDSVNALQNELDGRFSRAISMLNNSRDEMRAYLGKASSSLTSLQISVDSSGNIAALPDSTAS